MWAIDASELTYDDPVYTFARSSSVGGKVNLDASERGTSSSERRVATANGAHNEYSTQNLYNLKKAFIEEMRKLAKLRHPYIVTIMGVVTHGDEPLLVMEFMTNGSLQDLLHNETLQLDSELLLPMLCDILQGMRFLHAAVEPIIHGVCVCVCG